MIDFTGVRVELARKKMTQKRLAEITGIPVDVLDRICRALDCQPGDLMEYVPDPAQE